MIKKSNNKNIINLPNSPCWTIWAYLFVLYLYPYFSGLRDNDYLVLMEVSWLHFFVYTINILYLYIVK